MPVGCVRLEEVHPENRRSAAPALAGPGALNQARASSTASRPGRSFSSRPRAPRGMRSPYAANPPFRPKRRSSGNALERARREAGRRQRLGERRNLGVDAHAIVPRTVTRRIATGHQRRVRRQRDRRSRKGAIEAHATGRQPVDVWRPCPAVAVRAEPIGAQRVDGDEDEIARLRAGGWCWRRRGRGTAAGHQQPGERQTRTQRPAH